MVGAAITHLRRDERPNVIVNLVLLALAAFTAIERIGPQSLETQDHKWHRHRRQTGDVQ